MISRPGYAALVAESRRIGWPETFATDLTTHDRAFLEAHDPMAVFGWILRRDGTGLVLPDTVDGVGHRSWEFPRFHVNAFGARNCRFYWWDGARLEELPGASEMAERLRDAFTSRQLERVGGP